MKSVGAKSKKGFMLRQVFLGILDAFIVVFFGLAGALFFVYTTVPSGNLKKDWKPDQTSIIYDSSGQHILYEIYGEENRKVVEHQDISENMRKTTIAAEDDDFYNHKGFDLKSIIRAMKVNLEDDHASQGGSTITQQLARNIYLTKEKTIKRKIKEIMIATKIERKASKSEILDYYLNTVPYGSNAYGVESASLVFFGKHAKDLSLDEAALLASLPKATSYYSPNGIHRKELVYRQKAIIRRTADLGMVSKEEADAAVKEDTLAKVSVFKNRIDAPHFVFYAMGELEDKYGREVLEKGGFKIITTLDYDLQKIGESVVEAGVQQTVRKYGGSNASLVSLNPKTGGILAMVGSYDYFNDSNDGQVNVSTRLRQPGSSIKPIIYATAFENGYQPETRITDKQTNFGPDGSGRDYIPRNYSGTFRGNVSMRQALSMSLNIPAVKTLNAVGIDKAIDMANRLGIRTFTERKRYGLSLAIGGAEVTLLQETGAYSVFANDGVKNEITSIEKIVRPDGKIEFQKERGGTRVIDAEIARKISSILSDNEARTPVFGPNSPVFIPGMKVAAKTGTTQDFKDAWTVGYFPTIAAGVWTGNNDSRPMRGGADGVFVAAPIWHNFMVQAIKSYPPESFVAYAPVSKENVKEIDKPSSKEETLSALASNVQFRENLMSGERPKGWSKNEWKEYKKSLGL